MVELVNKEIELKIGNVREKLYEILYESIDILIILNIMSEIKNTIDADIWHIGINIENCLGSLREDSVDKRRKMSREKMTVGEMEFKENKVQMVHYL